MIIMENGLRTINIASMDPDSEREATTQQEIVEGLAGNRIHIAEIRETHITQDRSYLLGNYRIVIASADENETIGVVSGGTAIMIRGSTQHHVARITRQISQVQRVTLEHAKSK